MIYANDCVAGVRIIRTCVCHLERLDPDIVPAAVTMAKSSGDKMCVKHLKLLMKEWSFEMSSLIQVLDEMIEPTFFMEVSGENYKSILIVRNVRDFVHSFSSKMTTIQIVNFFLVLIFAGH